MSIRPIRYKVGDVFMLVGAYFLITKINDNNDIRCYILGTYSDDLQPKGMFVGKEECYDHVLPEHEDDLCFSNRYMVPFKEFRFSAQFLDEDDGDGVWIVGSIKPDVVEKLIAAVPLVLEEYKEIKNQNDTLSSDYGVPIIQYITSQLGLE